MKCLGCESSTKAFPIYKKTGEMHAFITSILIKSCSFAAISVCTSLALVPVSYAIFQHPQPKYWLLPFGYRLDTLEFGNFCVENGFYVSFPVKFNSLIF